MKAVLICLVLLISAQSQAASLDEVKQAIANDMDNILSDTVNEGDGSAYVAEINGKPDVSCVERLSKSTPGKKWYFCNVGFDVRFSSESELEGRSCRLTYSVLNDDLRSLTADDDQETSCIENLGSE